MADYTFLDLRDDWKKAGNKAINSFILDKHQRIVAEFKLRARKGNYGEKFSTSFRFRIEKDKKGQMGEIYSIHKDAKNIIMRFEEGRKGFEADKAFFIEKPEYSKGDKIVIESSDPTRADKVITIDERNGVAGVWVSRSGPVLAEHLFSEIAKTPPTFQDSFEKALEETIGGK